MAVLKHSSPTASPSAPKPCPQIIRPSANTTTPVAPSGRGACRGRTSAMGESAFRSGFSSDVAKALPLCALCPLVNAGQRENATLGHDDDPRRHQDRDNRSHEGWRQTDDGDTQAGFGGE